MKIDKKEFKEDLANATNGYVVQADGWCCGTCFFALSDELTNQDWQSLLLYRGDTKRKDLKNLPSNYMNSIKKIWEIIEAKGLEKERKEIDIEVKRMKGRHYTKRFGERKEKDNFIVKVTTFDGKIPVWVTTPKNPTEKQKEDTADFLLGELDDHEGYKEYFKKLKEFEE